MLNKCINRISGTFLAGSLGIGVHWVASQSGEKFEPVILGVSVFLLGVYTPSVHVCACYFMGAKLRIRKC